MYSFIDKRLNVVVSASSLNAPPKSLFSLPGKLYLAVLRCVGSLQESRRLLSHKELVPGRGPIALSGRVQQEGYECSPSDVSPFVFRRFAGTIWLIFPV